jgi:hypothetical protein
MMKQPATTNRRLVILKPYEYSSAAMVEVVPAWDWLWMSPEKAMRSTKSINYP